MDDGLGDYYLCTDEEDSDDDYDSDSDWSITIHNRRSHLTQNNLNVKASKRKSSIEETNDAVTKTLKQIEQRCTEECPNRQRVSICDRNESADEQNTKARVGNQTH